MLSERLRFILEADVSDAQRGFENLSKSADRDLGAAEQRIDRLGATMTRAGAAMLAAGGLAAVGLVKAADKTAALQTEMFKVDRVFGESAGAIEEFAEGAADSMGMSQRAAAAMAVELGRIGQKAGVAQGDLAGFSEEWSTIVGDAAAFAGVDPSEVIGAIGAATRGEFDPLERFGGTLTAAKVEAYALANGLTAAGEAMTDQAKVTATLALIQQDLAFTTGTLAERSADGALEAQKMRAQWENFQATLGERVLPIMQGVLGAGNDLLGWVGDMDDATNGLVSTVATWGTGLLLAGGAVSTVAGQVVKFRDNLKDLTTSASSAKVAIGLMATAMVAATAVKVEQEFTYWADRTDDLTVSLRAALKAGLSFGEWAETEFDRSAMLIRLAAELGLSYEDLGAALKAGEETWRDFSQSMIEAGDAAGLSAPDLLMVEKQLDAMREAAERLTAGGIKALTTESPKAGQALTDLGKDADVADDAVGTLADTFARLLDKFDTADAYDAATDALDDVKQAAFDAFIAAQTGALDAGAKTRELESDIRDAVEAVVEYADQVGDIDPQVITEIIADLNEGDYEAVQRKLDELERDRTVVYSVSNQPTRNPDRRAAGGPVTGGTPYLVGERGPELFVPGASGAIVPNHQIAAAGAPMTVNVYMPPGADGDDIVRALERYRRQNGGLPAGLVA